MQVSRIDVSLKKKTTPYSQLICTNYAGWLKVELKKKNIICIKHEPQACLQFWKDILSYMHLYVHPVSQIIHMPRGRPLFLSLFIHVGKIT